MDFGFDVSRALLWIILLPLAGAVMNGLFGRFASRQLVSAVGVGSVAASFVLAVLAFADLASQGVGSLLVYDVYEWFSVTVGGSEVPIRVRFVMDSLSSVMTLVVTGIGLLIHVYSLGYMHEDPGYARFFAYLNLFMASMLILVLASNLPLMFVGWEGVGLCSYLLIGFWWTHTDYAAAGRKAFVMNRIGDFGVLIAMFILVTAVGSFEFADINGQAGRLAATTWNLGGWEIGAAATVACLFLFLGCTGKSAQIPLYTWLPDAMAGPTPVSALIHAATMVTAGVYLCVRLSDLFLASPAAMAVIALIGAFTALFAASIALVQNHMKKILAYSTVSQLGFMFAAVGSGAFAAGVFHVYTHAFFKACLFLGAGSVMHAVGEHSDADIRKLCGLREYMPQTHWTFLVSCLAIAGVPFFSGFFSKDMILLGAATAAGTSYYGEAGWIGWLVFGVLLIAAVMTAFYMFRLYFRTFTGSYRSAPEPAAEEGTDELPAPHKAGEEGHPYHAHPHESPATMTGPLAVLGAGAFVAGYLNLDPIVGWFGEHVDLWGRWLAPAVATLSDAGLIGDLEHAAHTAHIAAGVGGLLAMAAGVGVALSLYRGKATDILPERMPVLLYRLLLDKWHVDELYQAIVVRPLQKLAVVSGWVDKTFVDGILTKATSLSVKAGGFVLTRAQTGVVYSYAAVLVVGMALVGWWFVQPQVDAEHEVDGSRVTWRVAPGLGYEFRWDADADGEWDTDWDASRVDLTRTYDDPATFRGHVLFIEGPDAKEPMVIDLAPDSPVAFDPDWLGVGWRDQVTVEGPDGIQRIAPKSGSAPTARLVDGKLVLRPNAASMRARGQKVTEEVELALGDGALIGGTALQHGARVEAVLQVRNAFGHVATRRLEAAVHPPAGDGGGPVAVRNPGTSPAEVSR